MKDFFVSYNTADRNWAEWIAWQLEEARYTTFLQAWDIAPGANFVLAMQKAVTECSRTMLIMSPNYLGSQYAQAEWATGFSDDPMGIKKKLIPVMVQQCKPPGLLGQLVYIDLTNQSALEAKRVLLRGVRLRRPKPKRSPDFPRSSRSESVEGPRFPPDILCAGPSIVEYVRQSSTDEAMNKEFGVNFLRNDLDARIARMAGYRPCSFLVLDIDNLTQINKHFGINVGDHVLAIVCALLLNNRAFRHSGRCGDDTFYAVVAGQSMAEGFTVAQEVCRAVEGYPWTRLASDLRATCSIGVVELAESERAADCISRAADGFQRAKAGGGNRVEYGPYLSARGSNWNFS